MSFITFVEVAVSSLRVLFGLPLHASQWAMHAQTDDGDGLPERVMLATEGEVRSVGTSCDSSLMSNICDSPFGAPRWPHEIAAGGLDICSERLVGAQLDMGGASIAGDRIAFDLRR